MRAYSYIKCQTIFLLSCSNTAITQTKELPRKVHPPHLLSARSSIDVSYAPIPRVKHTITCTYCTRITWHREDAQSNTAACWYKPHSFALEQVTVWHQECFDWTNPYQVPWWTFTHYRIRKCISWAYLSFQIFLNRT